MNTQGLTPEQVCKLEKYQADGASRLVIWQIANKWRIKNATQSDRAPALRGIKE